MKAPRADAAKRDAAQHFDRSTGGLARLPTLSLQRQSDRRVRCSFYNVTTLGQCGKRDIRARRGAVVAFEVKRKFSLSSEMTQL